MKVFFCPVLAEEEAAGGDGTEIKIEAVLFPTLP